MEKALAVDRPVFLDAAKLSIQRITNQGTSLADRSFLHHGYEKGFVYMCKRVRTHGTPSPSFFHETYDLMAEVVAVASIDDNIHFFEA